MKFKIYIPKKKGHYRDYALFLNSLLSPVNSEIIENFSSKIRSLFQKDPIIFLDVDDRDIYWIILRSLIFRKSYAITVSIERLLDHSLFLRKAKNRFLFFIFFVLKKIGLLHLISIHKETEYEGRLKSIVSLFTFDIQYYDLKYLQINAVKPKELEQFKTIDRQIILIFNNTSREKKNLGFLESFVSQSNRFFFIVVGNSDFLKVPNHRNTLCINRYVSNEELLYLMEFSDMIYCYYNNNKPSGFMGRGMQLNKYIIVEDGSYLSTIKYLKSVKVSKLSQLEISKLEPLITDIDINYYDDGTLLRDFLLNNYKAND